LNPNLNLYGEVFSSSVLQPGESYTFKFEEEGAYPWFVYPSIHEGFGLPPLEAMACGAPVIISNTSSLPEVGGDAALYVDPYSIESIQSAIESLVDDSSLRREMSRKSLTQSRKFSWDKTAILTEKIYNMVLGR